jgi:hypothetical protein
MENLTKIMRNLLCNLVIIHLGSHEGTIKADIKPNTWMTDTLNIIVNNRYI